MLFISLGVLLVTLVFMKLMLPYKIEEKKKTMASGDNSFSLVYSSTYLQWMLLAMFLTTSGGTMLAYQMNALVKTTIQDQAARAAFWANMNFWINGLGLFFQVVLVRFVILRFGMTTGLLISPLTDITGSLLLSCSPRLSFGSFCQVGRYSTEYSFNRASKEMLYTPTTREFKYQAKALIDTFVFRAGDGIISLVLILLASAPLRYIAIISLFVNLLRILPALALAKEYRAILEKSGEKPPV
jgi:AAA family ATP:ADP antiporter